MKPKLSVATSLDGFIARKDGSIDWLNNASATVPKEEDGGSGFIQLKYVVKA